MERRTAPDTRLHPVTERGRNLVKQSLDDDRLMERVAEGEEAAFAVLVTRWEDPVFAFLLHMLGNREEAEDLAQDTFLRLYDRAGRYRSDGLFRSWLFRIAGNLARSALRRRRVLRWVRFEPTTHDRADTEAGPDAALERNEVRKAVREAVARLPWRQRQAVVLKRFQGLSYREIADVMDTTVPAVESLMQRAVSALRKELEA